MWQSSNLFDTHKNIHRALLYLRVSSQSKDSGIYNRTARNTAILRGLMPKGIIIWVMPIPFNVGHCRGITERFKSQIQHNSNYVVFSDSGKSLVTSPLLEVWAGTRQSTETVSERVPTRWTKNEPRKKSAISFKDFKRVYSVQIRAFLGVFCVRYIIILPMPLPCIVERLRATTTHSESDIIQAAVFSDNLTVSDS